MVTETQNPDVTILGQAICYPKNLFGSFAVLFVCATIGLIVYLVLHATPEQLHAARALFVWSPVEVAANGSQAPLRDTMRLEFWTPSSRTKDYLGGYEERKWQAIANDEPVAEFGRVLRKDPNVTGYRRSEVWGEGRTTLKPGWWWTMTVRTNYSVTNLVSAYTSFWKSQDPVYIEIIDNRGHYEK